jgi:nucleoid DNA-binding protein
MSVEYRTVPNALTSPPSYSCRVVPKSTLGYEEVSNQINIKNPTIPAQTAWTVLESLREVVKEQLADGNTVNLANFISFVVSLPVRLATANDPLPANPASVRMKTSVSFRDEVNIAATYSRLPAEVKSPTINSAYDAITRIDGFIREGYGFRMTGSNLGFDPADAEQGVFLLSPAGNYIPQPNVALNDPSSTIIIPVLDTQAAPGGSAAVENLIEVRSKYTTNGQLRTGAYSKKLRSLNVISDATSDQLFLVGQAALGPAKVKTYTGSQVDCRFIAQLKPTGELVMSVGEVGGNDGAQVTITANGDYSLPGLDAAITVQVTDFDQLNANVLAYGRFMQEVCDLNPLT